MNSEEINRILKKVCGDIFIGVFPRDQLPEPTRRPCLFVANTDKASQGGTHWIAIYIDNNGEIFDSLAQPIHKTFRDYMDKHCLRYITNRQIQSVISRFCGHHCIVYCAFRSKGYSITAISNMYSTDTGLNDVMANALICKRLKM